MSFPFVAALTTGAVHKEYASIPGALGDMGQTPDGSLYRLCKAGAAITKTSTGAYNANRHLAGLTGESAEAALTVAIVAGDDHFHFADTTNPRVVDYYKDGYMTTILDPFQFRQITGSTAGDGTSIKCTIDPNDPFTAACAVSTVNVYPNPWGNVKSAWGGAASAYVAFVCVPEVAVTSGYYFWGKVRGPLWIECTSGNWPGNGASTLDVAFYLDGGIKQSAGTTEQRAGHMIVSGNYGDVLIMLQIE